jgi:predicted thioredoxin/glutaredoxin
MVGAGRLSRCSETEDYAHGLLDSNASEALVVVKRDVQDELDAVVASRGRRRAESPRSPPS